MHSLDVLDGRALILRARICVVVVVGMRSRETRPASSVARRASKRARSSDSLWREPKNMAMAPVLDALTFRRGSALSDELPKQLDLAVGVARQQPLEVITQLGMLVRLGSPGH